jgi:hypothetical protein
LYDVTNSPPSLDQASKHWTIGGFLLLVAIGVISIMDSGDVNDQTLVDSTEFASSAGENAPETGAVALNFPSTLQLNRAASHVGRTMGAMGGEGAMIYSELCYEALDRNFTVAALDRCYAFDVLAERFMEENDAAYFYPRFWPSNAIERWDRAARQSGLLETDLDARRSALENEVESIPVALIEPPAPTAFKTIEDTQGDNFVDETLPVLGEPSAEPVASDSGNPDAPVSPAPLAGEG